MNKKESNKNPFLESFYLALLEIIGQEKAEDLFQQQKFNPTELSSIPPVKNSLDVINLLGDNLEEEYGDLSAQGLLIRTGRGSLTFLRQFFPEIAELGSLENRLKPVDKRFFHSLEVLAGLWERETKQTAGINPVDRGEFQWFLPKPKSGEKLGLTPYFLFGLLEEFCTWLDARKTYRIIYSEPVEGEIPEIIISIRSQE